MSLDNLSLQKAVSDLSLIKRAIEASGNREGMPKEHSALEVGRVTHLFGAVIGGVILLYEMIADMSLTKMMIISGDDRDVGMLGISLVAMVLPVLLMCLYFVAWRESKSSGDDFHSFVGRNFRYLKNLSFVSDVVCKLLPLAVLALFGGGQWIAPILSLYLADFLIGGKYFIMPIKPGILAGATCALIAVGQWMANSSLLAVPLFVFVLLSVASVFFLYRSKTI